MDSLANTVTVTLCLLGSSAMAYAYAASIYGERNKQLEKKIEGLLSDKSIYHKKGGYIVQKI